MRLFTAIDIPSDLRMDLLALQDQLRPLADLQWSKPEKLHITTSFIGEWPEARLTELQAVLSQIQSDPIPIVMRGLGWMNPKLLSIGVEAPPGLTTLACATADALASIGVTKADREYHPHLTLARRKHVRPLPQLDLVLSIFRSKLGSMDFGTFTAHNFGLFLSRGGKYILLKEYMLGSY